MKSTTTTTTKEVKGKQQIKQSKISSKSRRKRVLPFSKLLLDSEIEW